MAWVVPMQVCEVKTLKLPKLKGRTMSSIVYKSGDHISVPMSENLFWNRVGWLRHAMLTAENFEFRLLYFHKLQDLMKFVP